ncbi:MAG: hypothetical protein F4X40_03695 [Chloroflexi bacterium]|nr:hypothetical protein [Chloroflexota bacterium]
MDNRARKVTKRQAATSQLETAIKLFLENRDLISAFTLCGAADGILEGIYKNKRGEILRHQRERLADPSDFRFSWREEWEIRIKPEHQQKVFRLLNEPQNFFKHADKDHDSTYEFNGWEQTGFQIFFAVTNYKLVFGELTSPMNVFFTLFAIRYPKVMAEGNPLLEVISANPDCMDMVANCSPEEIAAIGYSNLKSSCPELFVQRKRASRNGLPSHKLGATVPVVR